MSTPARQATAIAARDLRRELRAGEVLLVTIPFGAIALLVVPLAVGIDAPLLRRIGPGMYWVVVLLFGILVPLRRSAAEDGPQRDLVAMLGVDPAARFAGTAAAGTMLLAGFAALLAPVAIALYDPVLTGWPWLLALLPLVAAGLGLIGTLASGIAANQRAGGALVPLLVVPLSLPILLAATQTQEGLRLREDILPWILLLIAVDLLLAVAGVLTARVLQETR